MISDVWVSATVGSWAVGAAAGELVQATKTIPIMPNNVASGRKCFSVIKPFLLVLPPSLTIVPNVSRLLGRPAPDSEQRYVLR